MVFLKNCEIRYLEAKYGFPQHGVIALEPIKKGEVIWTCNCGDKDKMFTRDQLLDIIRQHPHLDYFVRSYSYMVDDDLYAMPVTYLEEKNNDECIYFNHSCDANCGFPDSFADEFIAMRDIDIGEEITYHYGTLESESSLIYGMKCKCGAKNCCGELLFDYYRDKDFADKHFEYMTPYLKQRVIDMKERWHSRKCYVKRIPPVDFNQNQVTNETNESLEEWEKRLYSLQVIDKDELVAKFPENSVIDLNQVDNLRLTVSTEPNCYIVGDSVFAKVNLPPETRLTVSI